MERKSRGVSNLAKVTVSNLLERKASEAEKKLGLDLADYLIKFDLWKFITAKIEPNELQPP